MAFAEGIAHFSEWEYAFAIGFDMEETQAMIIRSCGPTNRTKGIASKMYQAYAQKWELVKFKGMRTDGYIVRTDAPTVQRVIDFDNEYALTIGKLTFFVWFETQAENLLVKLEQYDGHTTIPQQFAIPYKANGNVAYALIEWACRTYPLEG